jgi:cytochrome c5
MAGKRSTLVIAALLVAVSLSPPACVAPGEIAPPVSARMMALAPGVAAETLSKGRRVFAGPCTACHHADPVGRYSLSEWQAIIDDDMAQRAKLDAASKAALIAYIAAAQKI